MKKAKICLKQPMYVGFTVLELSKTLMYDFHYGHIIPKYGGDAKLLFTDTDSLTYQIKTQDVYEDMLCHLDLFDTSEYPIDHPLYNINNKKKLGKMKDESFCIPPIEFVGLRPKMYSLKSSKGEKKTAKGIAKYVIKKDFRHEHYRSCLMNKEIKRATMNRLQSFKHEIYAITVNKIGLSPFDDKRYILPNGCDTLAHGHFNII